MRIRDATPDDAPHILALNEASVRFLSAMDAQRLTLLRSQASYLRVVESDGRVIAFLLAFREGSAYDSPNYRWFAARFDRFLYIDRVVVSPTAQGGGAGGRLYEDLFAFAASARVDVVTCEIDVDPPNPVSLRFHARHGFKELGTQTYGTANKLVSLQFLQLPALKQPTPSSAASG